MSEEEVIANLHKWEEHVKDAIFEIADRQGYKAANTAKENRRWKDVTGQARAGLTGSAEKMGEGARFVLSHTAKHGLYLELAHGRKYAIIEESLRDAAREAHAMLGDLLR